MNIRHFCLIVKNIEKSIWFYKDLLGMKIWTDKIFEGYQADKILDCNGVKLRYIKLDFEEPDLFKIPRFELQYFIEPKIDEDIQANSHISFTVNNIDSLYRKLKKEGIEFVSEPIKSPLNNVKLCFCYDPNGHLIELVENLK